MSRHALDGCSPRPKKCISFASLLLGTSKLATFELRNFRQGRLGLGGTFVTLPFTWDRTKDSTRQPKKEVELEAASLIVVCCPAFWPGHGYKFNRRSGVLSGVLITNKLNLLQVIFLRTPLTRTSTTVGPVFLWPWPLDSPLLSARTLKPTRILASTSPRELAAPKHEGRRIPEKE